MGNLGIPELLICLFFLTTTAFWVWMLIEVITIEKDQERLLWVIVIVFTHFIGAAIYFFVRRPARRAAVGR